MIVYNKVTNKYDIHIGDDSLYDLTAEELDSIREEITVELINKDVLENTKNGVHPIFGNILNNIKTGKFNAQSN